MQREANASFNISASILNMASLAKLTNLDSKLLCVSGMLAVLHNVRP
jgi:hypothetical protein